MWSTFQIGEIFFLWNSVEITLSVYVLINALFTIWMLSLLLSLKHVYLISFFSVKIWKWNIILLLLFLQYGALTKARVKPNICWQSKCHSRISKVSITPFYFFFWWIDRLTIILTIVYTWLQSTCIMFLYYWIYMASVQLHHVSLLLNIHGLSPPASCFLTLIYTWPQFTCTMPLK